MQKYSNGFLWIAFVFILLIFSFIFDIWGDKRSVIKHPPVNPEHFSKEPVRLAKFEPTMVKDGYSYKCMDCHKHIETSKIQKSFFSAHADIDLDHGANNYCMTCHSSTDRNMLIDINKNEVSFSQSQKTCFQCHGPIYRDWEKGVHGRMHDFWSEAKGETQRLSCVSCHDPHSPDFKPMHPAPGPNIKNYQSFLKNLTVKDDHHE